MLTTTVKCHIVTQLSRFVSSKALIDIKCRVLLSLGYLNSQWSALVHYYGTNVCESILQDESEYIARLVRNGHFYSFRFFWLHMEDFADCRIGRFSRTALMVACSYGHVKIVTMFLERKSVNINAQDDHGWTALMITCRERHINIVKMLLEHPNIDVNVTTNNKLNVLGLLCMYNFNIDIISLLLQFPNININNQDKAGRTALERSIIFDRIDIIECLLHHPDLDINIQNTDNGRTALLAVVYGVHYIMTCILQHPNINVNIQDKGGNTALMHACMQYSERIVETLLRDSRVDITLENKDGHCALDIARYRDRDEFMVLFCKYRPDEKA